MSADHTCHPWMNVNPSAMLVRCPRIVVFTATEMWPPMKQHSGLFLLSVCQCPVVTIMKLCVTISALNETHCSERHCMLYGEFSSNFSYIPMVWVPRALSSRTQDPEPWGRQETAPGRIGFYFPTCFMNVWMLRPPDETLMILISQPLTCFVETLLRNTFVYTFVLGCRDDLFFCPYCVSYYISCSWNLSFAPWGGSRTWKGCLHTPCRSCRSPRFVSFNDYRGSFIHSSVKWRNCLPSAWC